MYCLVARFEVEQQGAAAFIAAWKADRDGSLRTEPGTLRPDLVRDRDDPRIFHLREEYRDEEAFDLHAAGPWFAGFFTANRGLPVGPPQDLLRGSLVE